MSHCPNKTSDCRTSRYVGERCGETLAAGMECMVETWCKNMGRHDITRMRSKGPRNSNGRRRWKLSWIQLHEITADKRKYRSCHSSSLHLLRVFVIHSFITTVFAPNLKLHCDLYCGQLCSTSSVHEWPSCSVGRTYRSARRARLATASHGSAALWASMRGQRSASMSW